MSQREVRVHVWQPTDPEVEGHEHRWVQGHEFLRNLEMCSGCAAVRHRDWERYDIRTNTVPLEHIEGGGGEAVTFDVVPRDD